MAVGRILTETVPYIITEADYKAIGDLVEEKYAPEIAELAQTSLQQIDSKKDSSIQQIQTKGEQTLASIPEDYSQLSESIVESQIITNIPMESYIGGYITVKGVVSTNSSLGRIEDIELSKGSIIKTRARGSKDTVSMIYRKNNDGTYTSLVDCDQSSVVKDWEYMADEDMIVGMCFYVNYEHSANVTLAIKDFVDSKTKTAKITHINVGTGKPFTDIRTAIASITDSSEYNRYVVNVYEGSYRTDDETLYSSTYKGLILPDYVDIVGIGNRDNISLYWRGTSETTEFNNNISTLNVGGHNVIENITVIGKNTRYCVHDDFLATGETEQIYKNVKFIVETAGSGMVSASSNIAYGAGAEIKKKITFENCIFINENPKSCFFYHDITAAKMITGAVIKFVNCRFNSNLYGIQFTKENTTKVTNVYLYGCKSNKECFIRGNNTSLNSIYVRGFGNDGISFIGNGTIPQEEIDRCIDLI